MELKFFHFYPDLMSLYGSYANLTVLRRHLESQGHTVSVTAVRPGEKADLSGADFLFMGAGTERSQKAAAADFTGYGAAVKAAAADGVSMLFAGTALELLGQTVTDRDGAVYPGIGLGSFTSAQGDKRIVGDVYGATALYEEPVVGFMNKAALLRGVETPFLTSLSMGFGNEAEGGAEGFRFENVLGSELTGPILVKNPALLETVAAAVCRRRGLSPKPLQDDWARRGYAITAEQLKLRFEKR